MIDVEMIRPSGTVLLILGILQCCGRIGFVSKTPAEQIGFVRAITTPRPSIVPRRIGFVRAVWSLGVGQPGMSGRGTFAPVVMADTRLGSFASIRDHGARDWVRSRTFRLTGIGNGRRGARPSNWVRSRRKLGRFSRPHRADFSRSECANWVRSRKKRVGLIGFVAQVPVGRLSQWVGVDRRTTAELGSFAPICRIFVGRHRVEIPWSTAEIGFVRAETGVPRSAGEEPLSS